jgi:hypothetical protein
MFDLPRICKVHGTWVCKGDDTPERPARYSRLVSIPDVIEAVSVELLQSVARLVEPAPTIFERRPTTPPEAAAATTMMNMDARKALAIAHFETCSAAIEGQNGSKRTLRVAIETGPGHDLDPETTFRLLKDHYNPRCKPPWSDGELWHKVGDAFKKEPRRGWMLNGHPQNAVLAPPSENGRPTEPAAEVLSTAPGNYGLEFPESRFFVMISASHPRIGPQGGADERPEDCTVRRVDRG